jgi:hypothetical protein
LFWQDAANSIGQGLKRVEVVFSRTSVDNQGAVWRSRDGGES